MTDPTDAKVEALLADLKTELGAECEGVSDEYLLPFLHWKPSVRRASQRFRSFVQWKNLDENKGIFDETLRLSKDPELERCIASEVIVAPPNLRTNAGGPVLIGRFRNNDMTDGRTVDGVCRMMLYTVDRVLQSPEAKTHGLTVVHDLRGFDAKKNANINIPKKLFAAMIGHMPIKIKGIYICHAPLIFYGFFRIVSLFMGKKLRERIHFCDDFSDVGTVHDIMNPNDLLTELGGTLEFSIKDWIEEQKIKEESGEWKSLTNVASK